MAPSFPTRDVLPNSTDLDLGEVSLEEGARAAGRRPRRRSAALAAAGLAAAVLALTTGGDDHPTDDAAPAVPTGRRVIASADRIEVFAPRGLDDVLLLGAPYGVEDRGELVTIDLATGSSRRQVTDGELWPPGFKEPTTDPDALDGEVAARSPDGQLLAVFGRSRTTRHTGVTITTTSGARTLHRLQSVVEVIGRRLAWSPASDAVYFIAAGVDDVGDRVIGIPVGGSPQTVVRLDERGFRWIAVRS